MTLNVHLASAAAHATFFECLLNDKLTVFEFQEETGLGLSTVRKLLMILKRKKIIHVHGWDPASDGRNVIAVYALGNKPDALRPPGRTPTQRSAKRYAKLRLNRLKDLGSGQRESNADAGVPVQHTGGPAAGHG